MGVTIEGLTPRALGFWSDILPLIPFRRSDNTAGRPDVKRESEKL